MAGVEGGVLALLSGHIGLGGALVTADRINRPAEVSTIGVVLCEARHPGNRDGISGGGGRAAGNIPPGIISGDHVPDPRKGDHRSSGQTGWDFPPRPKTAHLFQTQNTNLNIFSFISFSSLPHPLCGLRRWRGGG